MRFLADTFALYLKTKNFHWHVSGPHFRDYHLMLDEQSEQIFATTDEIAERVRKIGGTTLRSIGHIAKLQNIKDNDADFVPAHDMLRQLMNDNKMVAASMRECHELAEKHEDAATAGLLENFIDGTERRTWFLFEASPTGIIRNSDAAAAAAAAGNDVVGSALERHRLRLRSIILIEHDLFGKPASTFPDDAQSRRTLCMTPSRDIERLLAIMAALRTPGPVVRGSGAEFPASRPTRSRSL